jgi:hypothetical protein
MSPFLSEKIASHIAGVLDRYFIEHPEDVEYAVEDIMEAIQQEIVWNQYELSPRF